MYKCAIIGAGGKRARGHADAYRHIRRGTLAAASSRNRERLDEFSRAYRVEGTYTDYREMLAREKPDLVHVNTPPDVRLEVMEAAEAEGIPALLVEKPLAIQGEDFRSIREFSQGARVKIAVNHQLHFQPRRRALQDCVLNGAIGELRFIEASSGMNLAYQGTHSLQAIGAFQPGAIPVSVFGQVSGARGFEEDAKKHLAPDECFASIGYQNGVAAVLRCGGNAPRVGNGPTHAHKRIAVYGSKGFVQWTMWSWEAIVNGRNQAGEHDYREEDMLGQAAMTEAMFDWMENERAVHPLNLEVSLRDFDIILGIYMSALNRTVIRLPVEPEDDLVAKLRRQLRRVIPPS